MSVDFKRYQDHLQQLVALPSVSCAVPEWDMSNQKVIDYLANCFTDLGFNTQVMPLAQSGKANLVATLGTGWPQRYRSVRRRPLAV
jgi:acetylornithine deacetylase